MPAKPPPSATTEDNHTLLVQLKDSVGMVGGTLDAFIKAQSEENRRIHERIDNTNTTIVSAVGAIKDGMAERGRITPSLVAMVLSSVAIFGGAGSTYVTMQTASLKSDTANNTSQIQNAEQARNILSEGLRRVETETARAVAQFAADRRWLEKMQDENRTRVHEVEKSG